MKDINTLIYGFSKKAAAPHYSQILNVYNGAKNLANAGKHVDPEITALTNAIGSAAARLLYNVDNFGVSPSTSSKYRNQIFDGVQSVITNVSRNYDFFNEENYKDLMVAADNLRKSLNNYVPVHVPAQKGRSIQMDEDMIQGQAPRRNPFEVGTKPGQAGYQVPSALPDVEDHPVVQYVRKQEVVPGPGGGHIPTAPVVEEEVGVASEKPEPFNFGVQGPQDKSPKLPATGRDVELEPWKMNADDGKVAARVELFKKLAK